MKLYLVAGLLRNLAGFLIFSLLTNLGWPINPALLVTILVGGFLYSLQVKISIGAVPVANIIFVYATLFMFNRLLLWLMHERWQLPLIGAQLISVLLLTVGGYVVMRFNSRYFIPSGRG